MTNGPVEVPEPEPDPEPEPVPVVPLQEKKFGLHPLVQPMKNTEVMIAVIRHKGLIVALSVFISIC